MLLLSFIFVQNKNIAYIYLKAMKASPSSPPTIWTPPSGMLSPPKYWRISNAFAAQGRFCNLIMTLISLTSYPITIEKRSFVIFQFVFKFINQKEISVPRLFRNGILLLKGNIWFKV